ncbi:MAG TPA: response regulator transcription factor [Chloroflexota bacterium]|jgi:two-component system OmpR family response regulator|nr:response regulator transcription factor [Chloroflexota bacterium]
MSTPVRVLVAEADEALARIVDRGLRAHGFEVASVDNAEAAVVLATDVTVRLIVLDLPGAEAVAARVRLSRPDVPVLWLTTGDPPPHSEGQTHALSLRKPFAFEELIGRIRALTRRANERRVTTLTAGDLRIDLLARCAWRGERAIDLPEREFALLEYFVRHPGRVLSRPTILADVWGYHFDSASNVVDVYVRYLRQKIDRPAEPSLIASVRGAGYRFDSPPETASADLATAKA